MLTKTKIAFAAAMLVGATSLAAAQGFDPNLQNRYPGYQAPTATAPNGATAQRRTFQSAPVGLYQGRRNSQAGYGQPSEVDVDRNDRASSPYAGGGF